MSEEAFQLESRQTVTLVHLSNQFVLLTDPLRLKLTEALNRLVRDNDRPLIVVDMTSLPQCSAKLLGLLVQVQLAAGQNHGRLVLASVQPAVRDVMKITKIDRLLPQYENADEAIQNLEGLK